MSLYQFLIAVRNEGAQLTSADGETTSHLMGTFYRTIRLVENGIKPVYVFDGKPPLLKSGELNKRAERREEAEKALAKAEEAGQGDVLDLHMKAIYCNNCIKFYLHLQEMLNRLISFLEGL